MKKNVMKNILAVSVVAAMAMSVAACGNTTETSAETEEIPAVKENFLMRAIPTTFSPSLMALTIINTLTALILLAYQIWLPEALPFPERLWGAIVLLICSVLLIVIAARRSRIAAQRMVGTKTESAAEIEESPDSTSPENSPSE